MTDLTDLTAEQLTDLISQAEARRQALKDEGKVSLRAKWEAEAKAHGLTLEEVLGSQPKPAKGARKGTASLSKAPTTDGRRGSPAVKFRGPSGEEWSGRGRLPNWLKALELEGRKKGDFIVG